MPKREECSELREIETAAEPSDAAPPVLLESVEGAGSTARSRAEFDQDRNFSGKSRRFRQKLSRAQMRQAAGCEDVMGRCLLRET